jgi:hypothetical protein
LNSSFAQENEALIVPKTYIFSWQKANGDTFELPVENNLKTAMLVKRLDRALMQIMLKSLLNSRDFETFTPEKVSLFSDTDYEVAKIDFTILGGEEELIEKTYYFSFDEYGNVFNQLNF